MIMIILVMMIIIVMIIIIIIRQVSRPLASACCTMEYFARMLPPDRCGAAADEPASPESSKGPADGTAADAPPTRIMSSAGAGPPGGPTPGGPSAFRFARRSKAGLGGGG